MLVSFSTALYYGSIIYQANWLNIGVLFQCLQRTHHYLILFLCQYIRHLTESLVSPFRKHVLNVGIRGDLNYFVISLMNFRHQFQKDG